MADKPWEAFAPASPPQADGPWAEFAAPTQAAPPAAIPRPKSGLTRRVLGDTAVDLGKGVLGVGEAAVGLLDLPTGGHVGKALETVGYRPQEAKDFLGSFYSPERQQANTAVEDAEGFVGTAKAMLENPSTIAGMAAESVPLLFGGGAVARGLGKVAPLLQRPVLRAALGEGAVGAGLSAEGFRQGNADGLLTGQQTAAAIGSGAGTALVGAAGGRIAQKFGIADPDTLLAGGAGAALPRPGVLRRVASGAVSEGVLEEMPQSMQEQAWQNVGNDRPLGEGVAEAGAMGLLAGAAIGAPVAGLATPGAPPPPTPDPTTQGTPTDPPLPRPALPAPEGVLYGNPDGSLATASQQAQAALQTEQAAVGLAQERARTGLTPDVNAARALHPGAIPNAPAVPFPDAPSGSLAAAANVVATPAPPMAGNGLPPIDVDPATGEVLNAAPAEVAPTPAPADPGQLHAFLVQQAHANGRPPAVSQIVKAFGLTPDAARAARKQAIAALEAEALAPLKGAPDGQGDAARAPAAVGAGGIAGESDPAAGDAGRAPAGAVAEPAAALADGPAGQPLGDAAGDDSGRGDPAADAEPLADAAGGAAAPEGVAAEPATGTTSTAAPAMDQVEQGALSLAAPAAPADQESTARSDRAAARSGQPAAGTPQVGLLPTSQTTAGAPAQSQDGIRAVPSAQDTPAGAAVQAAADTAATSPANGLPEPTEAQKNAGNYRKGHARVAGLDISIENPAGTSRRPEWPPLQNHYGYIKGSIGKDKDHVDVFLTEQAEDTSRPVFIVDQIDPKTGRFDEHKVILGAADEAEARATYKANYAKGWKGLGGITAMPQDQFRAWVKDPAATQRRAARHAATAQESLPLATPAAGAAAAPAAATTAPVVPPGSAGAGASASAPESAPVAGAGSVNDLVAVRDVYGETHRVRRADLDGDRALLPLYRKDGTRKPAGSRGGQLNRANIATDEQVAEANRDLPAITRRGAKNANEEAFLKPEGVLRAIKRLGQNPDDFEIRRHRNGYVGVRKKAEEAKPRAGTVGGKLAAGEVVLTASGRKTSPFPDVKVDTDRKATSTLKRVDKWLMTNAMNEAMARGDEFNASQFAAHLERPSQADKDAAEEYLFGEQPAVPAPLTRPLSAMAKPAQKPGEQLPTATAPEHVATPEQGMTVAELKQTAKLWREHLDGGGDAEVTHVFDAPARDEIVRLEKKAGITATTEPDPKNPGKKIKVYHREGGWMTLEQAKARIDEWEANALKQGRDPDMRSQNSEKIVLSLFDLTGSWSQPWEQAGYQVYRFDIQDDSTYEDPETGEEKKVGDIHNMSVDFFNDLFGSFDGLDVHAILAACPCTDFAVSGAKHFAAKDADGRTVSSVKLVEQTLAAIEYFKPAVWAVENPVGRIEELTGLPPWRLSFDPFHLGDDYTKKTLIWGRFNADLPVAPVSPNLKDGGRGGMIHSNFGGKSMATKNARSATPEGFAYAFFQANNAIDHPLLAVAGKYDRLDRDLIGKALDAGVTPAEIDALVEEHYYQELDDAAANEALRTAIAGTNELLNDAREHEARRIADRDRELAKIRGEADTSAPPTAGDKAAAGTPGQDQPTSTTEPAKQADKIEDFGEVLRGARKHYAAEYAERARDATEFDLATEPLSKTWPEPDYAKLLEGGADPFVVAWVHAARDEIPSRPRKGWKLKGWVAKTELLRDVSLKLLRGDINADTLRKAMGSDTTSIGLHMTVGGRAELYQAVGHGTSLKGVRFGHHHYTIYRGQKDVSLWVAERDAKATAYSNWPQELATGKTKEEAIANFKAAQAKAESAESEAKAVERGDKLPKFVIYSRRFQQGFIIGVKIRSNAIDLKRFETAQEARAYLGENAQALADQFNALRAVPFERGEFNAPRVGIDHRSGADVTPEQFAEAFGFRGVQFGNYVEGPRRQQDMNNAYDALMDLAGVLDIPSRALSLNGTLGLAFGARGKGGSRPAAAHFEPDTIVINLTKGAGAGSLAHEWFHGLDNYFSRLRGLKHGYATIGQSKPHEGVRPEMTQAFTRVLNAITQETEIAKRSAKLDTYRTKDYWSTKNEMGARSFESYVIAKLADQNGSNDYLANIVSEGAFDREGEYPYPTAAEIPAIRAAFDDFFDTLQTRTEDNGNVALFSRRGWSSAFPDAVLGYKPGVAQAHTDYAAAKAGDDRAALRLAQDLVTQRYADAVRAALPKGARPTIVPVLAVEAAGNNRIPLAVAKVLGQRLGLPVTTDIVQADKVSRGGSDGLHRIANAPRFDGEIAAGDYLILDDTLTQGGTLAALKTHLEDNGGRVLLASALTGKGYSAKLALSDAQLSRLRERYGAIEAWWRDAFGYGFDGLTESEARFLLTLRERPTADALRDRVDAARVRGIGSMDGRGVGEGTPGSRARLSDDAAADRGQFDVDTEVQRIARTWVNAPPIRTVARAEQLPAELVREYRRYGSDGSDVRGVYHLGTGTIYLVRDNVRSVADIESTLFHEAIGHHGLRLVFGQDTDRQVRRLVNAIGGWGGIMRYARAHDIDLSAYNALRRDGRLTEAQQADVLMDELFAHMAERIDTLPRTLAQKIREFLGGIRVWLRSNGFATLAGAVTDAELAHLLRKAERAVQGDARALAPELREAAAFSKTAAPDTFYSALAQAIDTAKGAPKKGDAAAWKGWLDGAQRRGEFRQGERDWLGVDAWLDGRETTTREELAAFVRANAVQVQDVVLGAPEGEARLERQKELMRRLGTEFGVQASDNGDGTYDLVDLSEDPLDRADLSPEAERLYAEWEALETQQQQQGGEAKFASYQLPGGSNYRELLLSLPMQRAGDGARVEFASSDQVEDFLVDMDAEGFGDLDYGRVDGTNSVEFDGPIPSGVVGLIEANRGAIVKGQDTAGQAFVSFHFTQPNILAHVRFNERTDADGQRVLFLEEIQSDWHQQGRKRGYRGTRKTDDELRTEQQALLGKSELSADDARRIEEIDFLLNGGDPDAATVPDAPFKATDEWAMLAFKRMVRWAAEHGFDRIAWTTGEQQAARYDLSKQVRRVEYTRDGRLLAEDKNGTKVIDERVPEDKIEDYIGKDVAKRLLEQTPRHHSGLLSISDRSRWLDNPADLRVGGEGMRGFYDSILPKAVNKWAKRFGGKVGVADLAAPGRDGFSVTRATIAGRDEWRVWDDNDDVVARFPTEAEAKAEADRLGAISRGQSFSTPVHSLDLNDAMREAALAGQALFLRASPVESEPFKRWFRQSKVVDASGKPRVVYHGTANEFWAFDKARLAGSTGHMTAPLGFFFDESLGKAEHYARNAADGVPADERVIDVYLAIQNPKAMTMAEFQRIEDHDEARALRDRLQREGFDGIHLPEQGQWIAFDPTQVKSATENTGTFDAGNPDIRFSFRSASNPTAEDVRIPGEIKLGRAAGQSVKEHLTARGKGKLTDLKPALLGAIPLNHLVDFAKRGMHAVRTYVDLHYDMQAFRNKLYTEYDRIAQDWLGFATSGTGLRGLFGRTLNDAGRALADLMHDATVASVDPTLDEAEYAGDPDKLAAYRELRARYDALPEKGQQLFAQVRDAYGKQVRLLEQTLEGNVRRAMEINMARSERKLERDLQAINESGDDEATKDQRRAAAHAVHDKALKAANQSVQAKIIGLRQKFEAQRVEAPYFPLKRYGRYWVTVIDDSGTMVGFSKFETAAEQAAFAAQMQKDGFTTRLKFEGDAGQSRELIDPRFVAEIEELIGEVTPENATEAEKGRLATLQDDIWQAYLERLPDMSLRKSFIHRKKVPGYHPDALRAFSSSMFHSSYQLARLKYGMELGEALDLAEEQANRNAPVEGNQLVNELRHRHEWILNPKGSAGAQVATTAAFVYHLGANPAHLLLNATQTVMLGVPILGSRYGFGRGVMALQKAARDFAKGRGHLDKANLTAEERAAFDAFMDSGLIDKTQAHDLAGVGETGVEYSAVRQKVMNKLGWFFHQSERFNREVTAMAAYRLARGAGKTHGQAVKQAMADTYSIHFDYSAAARPRYMQGDTAKVLLVFRNYNVNVLYRLFRDIHQSFRGETAPVRREARKQLGAMLGMYGLMAGTMGMPFYGLALALAGMFEDDDDPLTAEQQFLAGMVEFLGPDVARVLLRGVPGTVFDVDLSERIGMPNLWFRSPDRELEGRDAYYFWIEQLLGATPAVAKNVMDGLQLIHEGKFERGAERILPAAARHVLRAGRMVADGNAATTLDGEKITDLHTGNLLAQALGYTPLSLAEQYDTNRTLKGADSRLERRRRALLDRYFLAAQQGDAADLADAGTDIAAFNTRNPAYAISRQTLRRSERLRERNRLMNRNGIVMTRRMQALETDLQSEE